MSKEIRTRKVIAYEPGGIKIFDNVKEAATHYGTIPVTIYNRIKDGKEYNEVSFDYFNEWTTECASGGIAAGIRSLKTGNAYAVQPVSTYPLLPYMVNRAVACSCYQAWNAVE